MIHRSFMVKAITRLLAPGLAVDGVLERARALLVSGLGQEWGLQLTGPDGLAGDPRVRARVAMDAADTTPPAALVVTGPSDRDPDLAREFAQLVASSIAAARALATAQHLALTDQLTGLYNYRYFAQRIVEESERSRRYRHPLSLVILDSDALKRINDQFGHDQGNQHIQDIADTIRAHVRTSDITVRWGGDEFLIIQPECQVAQAVAIAGRIQQALVARPFAARDGTVMLRHLSAGVASWPATAADPEDLFVQADRALYEAKRRATRIVTAPARANEARDEAVASPRAGVGG